MRRLILPTLAATAVLTILPAAEAQRPSDRRGVVLYSEVNYGGRSETFFGNDRRLDDNTIGNDGAASVRVPDGCRITLYEHFDYEGLSAELRRDVANLANTRLGRREASSLKVDCGNGSGPYWPGSDDRGDDDNNGDGVRTDREDDPQRRIGDRQGALVFAESNFRGRFQFFPGAEGALGRKKIGDDAISSVRLASGCSLTLFADENFRGKSVRIDRDAATLRSSGIGPDTASSLVVDCDGPNGGVTLFADSRFRGKRETVRRDVPDLGRSFGDDRVGSVRVADGCKATLYENTDYRGRSLPIDKDAVSLVGAAVGPDTASSIRVRCSGSAPAGDDGEMAYGSGVLLYDRANFAGRGIPVRQDMNRLTQTGIGDDRASSIRIAPGCEARLFRDENYGGRGVLLDRSVEDLDTVRGLGSNELSSIRIQCNRRRR